MIDIGKKKLPESALAVVVYIGFCAMNVLVSRGSLAYYGQLAALPSWFTSDIVAFFIGGAMPTVVYYVISSYVVRVLSRSVRGGGLAEIRYGLCLTVVAANLLLFAVKFVYFAVPLYSAMLDIILDPVITIAFVSAYLAYAYKMQYVDRAQFPTVLNCVMFAFIGSYGLWAIINIVASGVQ